MMKFLSYRESTIFSKVPGSYLGSKKNLTNSQSGDFKSVFFAIILETRN